MLTVKKVWVQPISFFIGKIVTKRNPKEALIEKLIRKSKKGEASLFIKATRSGTNIKALKPRISFPSILKTVKKSFLSGEITIF